MQFKVILVVSIITLIVIALLILNNLDNSAQQIKEQKETALRVAEEAINKAFMKIAEDPDWQAGFEKDSSRGIEYEVLVRPVEGEEGLKEVVSIARIGEVERRIISRYRIVEQDSIKRPEKVSGGYMVY